VTQPIARRYVIDTNIAVYSVLPPETVKPELLEFVETSRWFMARALHHKVEMHTARLMLPEARNVIYRDGIAQGMFSLEDGVKLIQSIESDVPWTWHDPNNQQVYEMQRTLNRTQSTGDAEFLAVAQVLGCPFITTDSKLFNAVTQYRIPVQVILVSQHPWSQQGELEDNPPTE
jgi:predicted nucleic acid-binding protein